MQVRFVVCPMPKILALLAATFALLAPPLRAAEKLNLISIVTDDQAAWSLGCYGNKESRTPNMDRLAQEGARFANAFTVTPVCSPSRATFMTGRWGTQVAVTDYLAPNEERAGVGLGPGSIIWPAVLRQNGWATAHIGKWHLGQMPHNHPTKLGYDYFFGFLGGGNTPMNPVYDLPDGKKTLQGYGADLMTDDAMRWIGARGGKPFVMTIHYREPHLAYKPVPPEDSSPFENLDPTVPMLKGLDIPQVKGWTRDYYAAIHSVDRNLGRLFAFLEREKLWNKTIISFVSDHGYNIGHHMIHTKGNGFWVAGGVSGPKRPNMWDTSMRIPWMIRWPGVIKAGTVIEQPVQTLDTFKSMLGMLGVAAPAAAQAGGLDFTPLLRGENVAWREEIFGQYDLHNTGLSYMRMIRTTRWKFVKHYHENMMDELYDLKNDPGETRNLISGRQGLKKEIGAALRELRAKLIAWQKSIDDPVLSEPRLMQYEVVEDRE